MTGTINPPVFYSKFSNDQPQTMNPTSFTTNTSPLQRTYASNVREITRPDGSIVKEYVFENPNAIKGIRRSADLTSSITTNSSDDDQKSSKDKFAHIKAKFEQKSLGNIRSSPSSSSIASNLSKRNSKSERKKIDNRSNPHVSLPSTYQPPPPPPSISRSTSQVYANPPSSYSMPQPSEAAADVQYEMVDENGNPVAIEGIQEIIKMAGVAPREVQQDDGTILREYVIEDPNILNKVQSQRATAPSQSVPPPPPPPRVARRPSGTSINKPMPLNLQQVQSLETQQPYEYLTSSGRTIQFVITDLGQSNESVSFSSISPSLWSPVYQPPLSTDGTGLQQSLDPMNSLSSSAPIGMINPEAMQLGQFPPIVTEPIIDWSILRQQDPDGQIDPEMIRHFIQQRHQLETSQLSAQLQSTLSMHSPVKPTSAHVSAAPPPPPPPPFSKSETPRSTSSTLPRRFNK